MKTVSFNVAKAIKEAGYPQGNTDKCYLTADHNQFYKKGQIVENDNGEWLLLTKNLADIPTYIDTWLWLWREKKIYIDIAHYYNSDEITIWDNNYNKLKSIDCFNEYADPEEAIEKAIEFLVDNDEIG